MFCGELQMTYGFSFLDHNLCHAHSRSLLIFGHSRNKLAKTGTNKCTDLHERNDPSIQSLWLVWLSETTAAGHALGIDRQEEHPSLTSNVTPSHYHLLGRRNCLRVPNYNRCFPTLLELYKWLSVVSIRVYRPFCLFIFFTIPIHFNKQYDNLGEQWFRFWGSDKFYGDTPYEFNSKPFPKGCNDTTMPHN